MMWSVWEAAVDDAFSKEHDLLHGRGNSRYNNLSFSVTKCCVLGTKHVDSCLLGLEVKPCASQLLKPSHNDTILSTSVDAVLRFTSCSISILRTLQDSETALLMWAGLGFEGERAGLPLL